MDLSIINNETMSFLNVSINTKEWVLNTVGSITTQQLKNVKGDFNGYIKELKEVFFSAKFNKELSILTYREDDVIPVTKYFNNYGKMVECIFGTLRQILEYDERNNIIKRINIKPNGYKNITHFKYDEDGKLLMCTRDGIIYEKYEYDSNNRLAKILYHNDETKIYEYFDHNITKVTNNEGFTTYITINDNILPLVTKTKTFTSICTYDRVGRITSKKIQYNEGSIGNDRSEEWEYQDDKLIIYKNNLDTYNFEYINGQFNVFDNSNNKILHMT